MVRKKLLLLVVCLLAALQGQGRCLADTAALLEQAEKYEDEGNYEQAEGIYKEIAGENAGTEDGLRAMEELIGLYVEHDKPVEAEATYEEMLANYSEHEGLAKAVDHVADSYREEKEYEKARELYRYVVDTWPYADHTIGSHRGVVQTSIALGDEAGARAAIDKMAADYAENDDAGQKAAGLVDRLADEYRKSRNYERARELYELVVETWGGSEQAAQSQSGVARCCILLGDDPNAEAAIEKLMADYPNHKRLARAIDQLADTYGKLGRAEKARELYQYVVEHCADANYVTESQKGLVLADMALGEDANAAAGVEKLATDFAGREELPNALLEIARKYERAKSYEEAKGIYERLIEQEPDSLEAGDAELNIAKVDVLSVIESGDDRKAQEALASLISDFNDYPGLGQVVFGIGQQCYDDGKYQKAAELLEKYCESGSEGSSELLWVLAVSYRHIGEWEKAIERHKLLLERYPMSERARLACYMIGSMYRSAGRYADAVYWFEEQRGRYSDELYGQRALFEQGVVYFLELKEYGKGAEVFRAYVEAYPDDEHTWPAYRGLAKCYERVGARERAIAVLQEALESLSGGDGAEQISKELERMQEGGEK
jgi:tetratricopeptide (TPR) repeat protein